MADKKLDILVSVKDLVTGNVRKIKTGIQDMARSATESFKKVGGAVFSVKGAVAGLAGALATREIIEAASSVEIWRAQLQALIGDQTEANAVLQDMRDFAAASPLATQEVIDSFVQLRAVGIDGAKDVTKALGNVSLVFNKNLTDVSAAFIGLETEVLRKLGVQLERTGKTAKLMSGDMELSVENSSEAIRAGLLQIFEKRFPDAMSLVGETWQSQMAVMKSAFFELFAGLGEIIFPTLKKFLRGIGDFVGENREILLELVRGIPERFGIALDDMKFSAQDVTNFLGQLVVVFLNGLTRISIAWSSIKFVINKVMEGVFALVSFVGTEFPNATQKALGVWDALRILVLTFLADVIQKMSSIAFAFDEEMSDALQNTAAGMRATVRQLKKGKTTTDEFVDSTKALRDQFRAAAEEDAEAIKNKSLQIVDSWEELKGKVSEVIRKKREAAQATEFVGPGAPAGLGEGPDLDQDPILAAMRAEVDVRAETLAQIRELNLSHFNENNALLDQAMSMEASKRKTFLAAMVKFEANTSARRLNIASSFMAAGIKLAEIGGERTAKVAKALALSQAVVDGIAAVQKALANPPGWPFNAGQVAAVGALQAANVAAIASASFGGGGPTASVGSVGGGGGGAIPAPTSAAATGPAFGGPAVAPTGPAEPRRLNVVADDFGKGPVMFESGEAFAQWFNQIQDEALEAGALG